MKLSALAIVTVVSLAGCATQVPTQVPTQSPTQSPGSFSTEPDHARIQAIDYVARHRGVQVVWINLPLKAVRVAVD